MTENRTVLDNVLGWLHEGYPEGVPQKDYFPLLALLKRSLTEEEVVKAAQSILKSNNSDTVTEAEIRDAVHAVIEKEPNPEEIHQVAARLASVGWPLASPTS
jgi:hypothetical protein